MALLAAATCLGSTGLMQAKADNTEQIPVQTASGREEAYVQELDGFWSFGGKGLSFEKEQAADYTAWEQVNIPHTWNAKDAEDGGNNYARGAYWYHKEFEVEKQEGKRIYIEFLGSNQKTEVYVNGQSVGEVHKGGYTTFRYDITEQVQNGKNTLDVRVDNTVDQSIAPISGDFNMYGGIYRRVYLITVDEVHVDLMNHGSSGLFLTTGNMRSKERPEDLGTFTVEAEIVNTSDKDKTVTIVTSVEGDNAPAAVEEELTIPANSTKQYTRQCVVENPTLWEGIRYTKEADNKNVGYQYTVTLEIREGSDVLDKVSDKLGFRYFWIDSKENGESGEGFFLNGEKYPLRGVNRHSYLAGVGSAMTEEQHQADMDIMLELGINTIRLCHYPQTDYMYDLCDANGIIVWTEIPIVNMIGSAADFADVTKQQLRELIRQQYNRPSVCIWGLENEIGNGTSLDNARANVLVSKAKQLLYELDAVAKEEDPSGRYTTQAVNRDYSMDHNEPDSVNNNFENNTGWKSDIVAWNIYPGWYPDANFYGTFEDVMVRKTALDSRSMGISEYGWGANVKQHEAYPALGQNNLTSGGAWHPEEYQNLMNEEALAYINTHDELWGTYYWVMFDFAVDARNEGGQPALNDKGLVTADRSIKKDSYYLYKANWNKAELFTYITSRRWEKRDNASTYIKVYSNCDEVELLLNGESLGKMENKGNGVFLMENVTLAVGEIKVETIGTCSGSSETYKDSCVWERVISNKAELASDTYLVDESANSLLLNGQVTLAAFKDAVWGLNNAVYQVFSGEQEITEETAHVLPGMTVKITAEDGKTTGTYTITASNLCTGRDITVSSEELGNEGTHAVDGNIATQWVAVNGTYPQHIIVDLETEYYLGDLTIDWYRKNNSKTRYYKYKVEVSEDGQTYTQVLDKTKNTTVGTVTDSLELVKARYIKIIVTGCNESGWAGLYEIKADGYMITSEKYTIDQENKQILVGAISEQGLAEGEFAGNISISGNYTYTISLSSGWIREGNTVTITDADGKEVAVYTIISTGTPEPATEPTPEPAVEPTTAPMPEPTVEPATAPTSEPVEATVTPEKDTVVNMDTEKPEKKSDSGTLLAVVGVAAAIVAVAAAGGWLLGGYLFRKKKK